MLATYIRTIRHLKPQQVVGRVFHYLHKPKLCYRPAPELRQQNRSWCAGVAVPPSMLAENKFNFLNVTHCISSQLDWNNSSWDKLWLYNLHYFDDLNSDGAEQRKTWHKNLLHRWIEENEPGAGNGWEPYPTSLRIVNWIKWSLAGNHLEEQWLNSLAIQVRYLAKSLETHLLGNHLLANAKALVFAGCYFSGTEADAWLKLGLHYLTREVSEQILPDGGHFELSPMYHAIILHDILDLVNILQTYTENNESGFRETLVTRSKQKRSQELCVLNQLLDNVHPMLKWLEAMTHPDGEITFFNDAAFRIAPTYIQLLTYSQRLANNTNGKVTHNSVEGHNNSCFKRVCCRLSHQHLAESGYVRVESQDMVALLDVAPIGPDHLPGHAHADTLSFELSLFNQRVIVNGGTSCYGISELRQKERSTCRHSTVEVAKQNSSEVWSGFRVARRAYPCDLQIDSSDNLITIACSHTGYRRLKGKPTHRRTWQCTETSLCVTDSLDRTERHAVARYILHPDIIVEPSEHDCEVSLKFKGRAQREGSSTLDRNIFVRITSQTPIVIERAYYAPEFGKRLETFALRVPLLLGKASLTMDWSEREIDA